jgi:hypothetical protein
MDQCRGWIVYFPTASIDQRNINIILCPPMIFLAWIGRGFREILHATSSLTDLAKLPARSYHQYSIVLTGQGRSIARIKKTSIESSGLSFVMIEKESLSS